jgi:hypothetical protein
MAPDAGGGLPCLTGASDVPIGGACNCTADCVGGALCSPESEAGSPNGVCSVTCTPGTDGCDPGTTCVEVLGSGMGLCQVECTSHADCGRPGWACFYNTCGPHCVSDSDCQSGQCNPYRHICDDGAPGMGGGVLAPCSRDEDCLSGACLTPIGGYCFTSCIPELDNCPPGSVCIGGVDSADPGVGICLPPCESSATCPGDLECLDAPSGDRVCYRAA